MKKSYMPLIAMSAAALLMAGCFGKKDVDVVDELNAVENALTEESSSEEVAPAEKLSKVVNGARVYVNYIGRITDNKGDVSREQYVTDCSGYDVFDTSYEDVAQSCKVFSPMRNYANPFSLIVGQNQAIPGFEKALIGAKVGDIVTVDIPAAEAYGTWSEEKVRDFAISELPPKNGTGADAEYKVGDKLGTQIGVVTVHAISGDMISVDFNHELADKDLTFNIEVMDIETVVDQAPTQISFEADDSQE